MKLVFSRTFPGFNMNTNTLGHSRCSRIGYISQYGYSFHFTGSSNTKRIFLSDSCYTKNSCFRRSSLLFKTSFLCNI
eukprot:UN27395